MRMYQLTLFAGAYAVRDSEVTTALDLTDVVGVSALLNGHMEGALLREGIKRERWHEYVLRVYEFRADRGVVGDLIMRWVLPAVKP